jgi:hypothetical protein
MVSFRRRIGALIAGVVPLAGVLLFASPAQAADTYVQVNPSTVRAGHLVGIKASCTENNAPATVESPAFGTITVQPQNGLLTAAALVPEGTDAGSYRVRLHCPDGKSASTMLNVVAADKPSRGPATGFGGTAGGDSTGGLLLYGGLATILAGAALGVVTLRRRASPAVAAPRSRTRS